MDTVTLPREDLYIVIDAECPSEFAVPPCEGAWLATVRIIDVRTVDHPSKLFYLRSSRTNGGPEQWWYSSGANHRVENGRICRDFTYKAWVAYIGNIREFVDTYHCISLCKNSAGYYEITLNQSWD